MRELYDDCFYVEETRWKTWASYDTDGNQLVSSYLKQDCVNATWFYLKRKQEKNYGDCGLEEGSIYEGNVGGKL